MFKAGSQIRCLESGKLFLVVQSYKYAVLVLDLESGEILNQGKLVAERDWDKFVPDVQLERKKFGGDQYIYSPIQL